VQVFAVRSTFLWSRASICPLTGRSARWL